jgi:hypothetical protein
MTNLKVLVHLIQIPAVPNQSQIHQVLMRMKDVVGSNTGVVKGMKDTRSDTGAVKGMKDTGSDAGVVKGMKDTGNDKEAFCCSVSCSW